MRGERLADQGLEEALAALLYDARARADLRRGVLTDPRFESLDPGELDDAAEGVRRMVLARTHRGSGGLRSWFPETLVAWRKAHPEDDSLDELISQFCQSDPCRKWREGSGNEDGISLEESLFQFFTGANTGDPAVREEEFLGALVRALAIAPDALFARPVQVERAPGGCYALTRDLVLHAAIDGQYLRGRVTPLLAALLAGDTPAQVARRFDVAIAEVEVVAATLAEKRLRGCP